MEFFDLSIWLEKFSVKKIPAAFKRISCEDSFSHIGVELKNCQDFFYGGKEILMILVPAGTKWISSIKMHSVCKKGFSKYYSIF